MKRTLWMILAVLLLFTGCGNAVDAPEQTAAQEPTPASGEILTATLTIGVTCGSGTVKGEITAQGAAGESYTFAADEIEEEVLKIPIPDGYTLTNSEARDIAVPYGETKAMYFVADKTDEPEFGYLSIRNLDSGEIVSLGSMREDIDSVIGAPIEKYGNIYLYNGGLFIEYDSNDVANEFSMFSYENTICAWELNSGIVAGKSAMDDVFEAYGKDSGYWLDGDLFYMLCEDGSTESVSDYDVMYGIDPADDIAKVIVMTRHATDSSAQAPSPQPTETQAESPTEQPTVQQTEQPAAQPTTQPTADQTAPTTGMKNALSSAKRYISILSFSHEGLMEQLKYEGYTDAEAKYGADNCGADWMEQAEKKAKEYIDVMAFSYKGLIKQLKYDGFTEEQATHGVDLCGADWMEQAEIKAADYLEIMSFSRSGLIDQLKYEGFTQEQAEYGAAENGLS